MKKNTNTGKKNKEIRKNGKSLGKPKAADEVCIIEDFILANELYCWEEDACCCG